MSFLISHPKAEQLVKHFLIVRNSCLTWLVIFCWFVPSTFCATANPVLSQPHSLAPRARLWSLIYSGASLFLSRKDLSVSVSVLVQFSFPGPLGGVLYLGSFFALSDVSVCSSGYGALWSIDELFRQQNTFWKGLQMTFVIRPRPCCLSYCCFLFFFFCLKFEFLHYSVLCSQWTCFSLNEALKHLHPQQWWDKNDAPTAPGYELWYFIGGGFD